jgi:transmembrane sensor
MDSHQNRLTFLFKLFSSGRASAEQVRELLAMIGEDTAYDEQMLSMIVRDLEEESVDVTYDRVYWSGVFDKMRQELAIEPAIGHKRSLRLWGSNLSRSRMGVAVAAAMATVIFGVGLFYFANQKHKTDQNSVYANDIPAGKMGATLTLANGKQISLTEAANGKLAEESGIAINKTAEGKLVYKIKNGNSAAGKINTLSTTTGETYQVLLPDGTSVWLNSVSTLSYPASFAKLKERKVRLTGEGYFQVAKDKTHPFIVSSENQEVEVLGTHFNVSAYSGEAIKTTLLEGSVKIGAMKFGEAKEAILKPGEQSSLSSAGLSVKEVNSEYAVAWTKGYFLFNNETLEEAMLKIGRWYNVQVVYDDPALKRETLFGTISRFGNISGVFKMIERADVVRFDIEGKTVHIKRKKSD